MSKKKSKSDRANNEPNKIDNKQEVNKEIHEEKIQDLSIEERLEDAENRILRTLAETENLRKRYEREKEDLSNYVISNFAKLLATSNSPTPSMFAAIIGIPDHSLLLYLNLYVRLSPTSFLLCKVLLFGLKRTSV